MSWGTIWKNYIRKKKEIRIVEIMDSINRFIEKIQSDGNLKNTLVALSEKGDKEAVRTLMTANGVTDEDFERLKNQSLTINTTGELSDDDLQMVSAGGAQVLGYSRLLKSLIE